MPIACLCISITKHVHAYFLIAKALTYQVHSGADVIRCTRLVPQYVCAPPIQQANLLYCSNSLFLPIGHALYNTSLPMSDLTGLKSARCTDPESSYIPSHTKSVMINQTRKFSGGRISHRSLRLRKNTAQRKNKPIRTRKNTPVSEKATSNFDDIV